MKVPSDSHASFYTINRFYCSKQPNRDQSKEVSVVEYQVLFRKMRALSRLHSYIDRPIRLRYTKQSNQNNSEEMLVVEFQALFRETKVPWNIHLNWNTPHHCCCKAKPYQDDWKAKFPCRLQVIFQK